MIKEGIYFYFSLQTSLFIDGGKTLEIILHILKENRGHYISGESLAKVTGITRAGVWKQIEHLREIGYRIDSIPHKGYCLSAVTPVLHPLELKENLNTAVFGKKIYYQPEVDSTNQWARSMASQGEEEGAVFIAETQTHGKGRLGRSWVSAPGMGLWVSLILRPRISPAELAVITVITAVAAAQAIKTISGIQVQIKWPNDLVYQDRKLGGILAELNGEMDRVHYLIVGIGMNVNHETADFPSELAEKATSLRIIRGGGEIPRKELLGEFLRMFEGSYFSLVKDDVSPDRVYRFIEYATGHSATLGKKVTISQGSGRVYQGEALGLEPDGSLKVKDEAGNILVIHSGEIIETV
jgi:BirA family biotin operon repressor/biotin-[acetyl-CoA-carboxylase] ligase